MVQHVGSSPPSGLPAQAELPSQLALPWLPSGKQQAEPTAWADAIQRVLPPHLRRHGSSKALSYINEQHALSQIVLRARRTANIDVLSHLALVEQQWEALLWVTSTLLESPAPPTFFHDHTVKTSARWPTDQSLDTITSSSRAPESLFSDTPREATAIADPSVSLDDLTGETNSALQAHTRRQSRDVLGEIWRTLGRLITVAASDEKADDLVIMPAVLRMIAQLHRQEYVPSKAFGGPSSDAQLAVRQPPLLHSLSNDILMALIDTSVVIQYSYGHDVTVRNPPLRPELWLEFVLWCCVHGGWLQEGTAIVNDIRKLAGNTHWRLISWYTGPQPFAKDWSPSKAKDMFLQPLDPAEEPADAARIKHTISSEVVVALVDGLATVASSPEFRGGPNEAILAIQSLKNTLARSKMSLGMSAWDEVVARLAELPSTVIDQKASTLEKVLELSETFGRETSASNALDKGDQELAPSSYVFDGSAATIGLYHRLLATYVRDKDTDGALRILARLQNYTDVNKTTALQAFLVRLTRSERVPKKTSTGLKSTTHDPSKRFEKLDYPSFFPNVPPPILAALLDLVTESRAFEIGEWMIHTEDVDGPLIPPELYSDQSIAAALIRFAAENNDASLLKKLRQSQTRDLSGKTLVALAESHIARHHWSDAGGVLTTMNQYSLHDWEESDFARIVGAIISHTNINNSLAESDQSLSFLTEVLRGHFGRLWQRSSSRDSMAAVVSTVHPTMAQSLASFLDLNLILRLDLTTTSFELLLSQVVRTYGSFTGMRLWELWCRSDLASRQVREPDRSKIINIPISQLAELFSAGQGQPGPSRSPPLVPNITGHVEPTIATLRIIVGKALAEHQQKESASHPATQIQQGEAQHQMDTLSSQVLNWAADVFAERFDLRAIDVEHELQGYSMFREQAEKPAPLYSKFTMKIWRALWSASPNWLMTNENKMRGFAQDASVDQIVFDATDSAGRKFLHHLAQDFGLISESFGEDEERQVSVFKTPSEPIVPSMTVGEAVRRGRKQGTSQESAGSLEVVEDYRGASSDLLSHSA